MTTKAAWHATACRNPLPATIPSIHPEEVLR